MIDQVSKETINNVRANMLVPLYLMASYLYYHEDKSMMTDEAYDRCCQRLNAEWWKVTHVHKRIIDRPSLTATTGFTIARKKFPLIVRHSAHMFYDDLVLQGKANDTLVKARIHTVRTGTVNRRKPDAGNLVRRDLPTFVPRVPAHSRTLPVDSSQQAPAVPAEPTAALPARSRLVIRKRPVGATPGSTDAGDAGHGATTDERKTLVRRRPPTVLPVEVAPDPVRPVGQMLIKRRRPS